mmetsp:Transcript_27857/g.75797  ORF Transcript_27857/g.75797 Transcript_27857/m.75797 type:complete len:164 (-) Transcript_27857:841-1332(-)|eukprot:CAMPEP_0172371910 /NCGR_PEP_ID=MMETSP1060-20121228/45353_1 /TAXON_ID=37318 /ORGANISM="Pseudo-nitzschia pungens, Strain cf. cingulata" /LENGTH=163 /DNA_ID=CAMNT_0013097685 /DNA_START=297 /DNA_END=788 /DNA_ORIENTATION=+
MMSSKKTIYVSAAQAFLLLCIFVLNTNALAVVASDERNSSLRGALIPTTSSDHENENSLPDITGNVNDEINTLLRDSVATSFRKLLAACGLSVPGGFIDDAGFIDDGPSEEKKWMCKIPTVTGHPKWEFYATKKDAKSRCDSLKQFRRYCKRNIPKEDQEIET